MMIMMGELWMGLFPAFVLLDQVEAREDDFIVFLLSLHRDASGFPRRRRGLC
jgi:hypothetical protein